MRLEIVRRTLGGVQEGGPDEVLDAGGLCCVGDGLALGDFGRSVHLLEEVGDGEDAIGALKDGSNGLGGVQVGLELLAWGDGHGI